MRSSPSRAVLPPTRDNRFRDAGLSGARALSRLLVALIESLGQHDRAGRRPHGEWPHGTMRSAFGPTPLGAEIERVMAATPRTTAVHASRDAVTGLPLPTTEPRPAAPCTPILSAAPVATPPAGLAPKSPASTRPPVSTTPMRTPGARAPTVPRPTPPPPPSDPLAAIPLWQRPFLAAPGVRYMRTPDHLLRRARVGAGDAIAPIEPQPEQERPEPDQFQDDQFEDLVLPENARADDCDDTIAAADDVFPPDTDFIDEVEALHTVDQLVSNQIRSGAQRRLSLLSGFVVDVPSPANDLVRSQPNRIEASTKTAFAVSVRAKSRAAAPVADTAAVAAETSSPAAISARVSLQAEPARLTTKRPVPTFEYDYPSVELLGDVRKPEGTALTADMLEQNARLLETTLEDFGIRGEIIHVRAGPVVTLYELEPAPGMKSSRVIGLADDIARSMSALSARVAVVPGRNAIGIELPNERRETVFFREMVECEAFADSKHKLAIALGKTIGGEPVIAELAKMPHLLVAGTTGSGKSVAINTMILSLLYRLRPDQCRLIMVDPKMLELSVYDGIPHLLTPVVTDPKKAVVALKWAVREMEDRYKKMSKLGVRNIDGFNARVVQAKANGEIIKLQVTTGFDRETGKPTIEDVPLELVTLPYIVVIVDEMADLMMVAGKDIEGAIQRLAQMARAAGIHLIMATQRPSVDVITGTIKANFPTRISFQVTSKIDSRTILGEQGAEQLLGQGDMLHMQGGGRIYRVHGPFVSDDEVERVVAHLKTQGVPDYLDSVTDDPEGEISDDGDDEGAESAVFDKTAMGGSGGEDDGSLYEQAVKVVLRDKKSSVSYVQRRLQVGYNKAASLIERMEKEGILGPASHTGKREILAHSRARVITGLPDDED